MVLLLDSGKSTDGLRRPSITYLSMPSSSTMAIARVHFQIYHAVCRDDCSMCNPRAVMCASNIHDVVKAPLQMHGPIYTQPSFRPLSGNFHTSSHEGHNRSWHHRACSQSQHGPPHACSCLNTKPHRQERTSQPHATAESVTQANMRYTARSLRITCALLIITPAYTHLPACTCLHHLLVPIR